jgi:hypothetical protein
MLYFLGRFRILAPGLQLRTETAIVATRFCAPVGPLRCGSALMDGAPRAAILEPELVS